MKSLVSFSFFDFFRDDCERPTLNIYSLTCRSVLNCICESLRSNWEESANSVRAMAAQGKQCFMTRLPSAISVKRGYKAVKELICWKSGVVPFLCLALFAT
jgi:hypothetical protein